MRKATKGVLAATAGALILLAGAGTLAAWTDSRTISGGAIRPLITAV